MPILLLPPRYTPDSIALWRAATHAGWQVRRLYGWRVPPSIINERLAVYGEPLFAAAIAEQADLMLLEPPPDWLTTLPRRYVGRKITFTTLAKLTATSTISFPAFVKPAQEKSFPAQVYQALAAIPLTDILPATTPVLVSEAVTWELEIRAFIKERQLRTLSLYARWGKYVEEALLPEELTDAHRFLDTLLADEAVSLPPAVVVDIGRTTESGWAVVEANPCWSAGIYGCDAEEVLMTIARACIQPSSVRSKRFSA